jgi:hypothetical protein
MNQPIVEEDFIPMRILRLRTWIRELAVGGLLIAPYLLFSTHA